MVASKFEWELSRTREVDIVNCLSTLLRFECFELIQRQNIICDVRALIEALISFVTKLKFFSEDDGTEFDLIITYIFGVIFSSELSS